MPENEPTLLDSFFEKLPGAAHRVLFLDYDGTLAPFRTERDQAVPYPGVREIVSEIMAAGHTRLVIISGRAVDDLLPLLGLEPAPEIWGSHGWERRLPNDHRVFFPIKTESTEGLAQAMDWAREEKLTDRIETKPACVALHWRGLDPTVIDLLREKTKARWEEIARRNGLELQPFDGGLELRVPGRDKGIAVETVLKEVGNEPAVAYLGDDLTDEDAFRTIEKKGLPVLVRKEPRESRAALRLEPPEQLLDFLKRWHQAAGNTGPK